MPRGAGWPSGPITGGVEAGQATRTASAAAMTPTIAEPSGRRRGTLGDQPSRRATASPTRTPKAIGGSTNMEWTPRVRTNAMTP